MSFHAIMQALNLPDNIKGNGRLTAIAIANRVNIHPEHGNTPCAWPSIKGLAADIGASKSATKNSLNILEELNIITRIPRVDDGRTITTLYKWHPWLVDGWDEARMHRREVAERGYDPQEATQEPQEQPNEPAPTPDPTPVEKPAQKPADGFDQWWATYPKKVKKRDAEKAYRAALKTGATPEQLLQALHQHVANWKARGTAPQYIPYPATWLRAGSWEDELTNPDTSDGAPPPVINPDTGKPLTRDDFGYACLDAGINPNRYINYWKPYMGLPSSPQWPHWAAKIDKHCGRA